MRSWIIVGAIALLAACDELASLPTEPSVSVVGDTAFVELPVSTTAVVGAISIHFDGVTEDSRCPIGVTCVWEGNGSVELTVSHGADTEVLALNTTTPPKEDVFAGLAIRLTALDPYPHASHPTDPDAYVVSLVVFQSP